MKHFILAATAVALAAAVAPASASSAGCPSGFFSRGTGVYNPLSHREITYCYPILPSP